VSERVVCTVSELAARIKARLEDSFPTVWVEGEISNLRTPSSGHAYFTLKDDTAQLKCVLFRSRGRRVAFQPEDGMQVLAFGGLDVYMARGEYQLVVELMEPKGVGALQLAFEQLKRRLEAEGLFEAARKRPIPSFPIRTSHRREASSRRRSCTGARRTTRSRHRRRRRSWESSAPPRAPRRWSRP